MKKEVLVRVHQFEVQSVVSDENAKKKNTDHMCKVIAKNKDADLIVFPELAFTGYIREFDPSGNFRGDYWERGAEKFPDGEGLTRIAKVAKETGCHVITGFLENSGIKYEAYDSCVLITPDGSIKRAQKMHIPIYEKHYFIGCDKPQKVFDTSLGKIGMMVCYDLMFPETARLLAMQGAEIIICPANWTASSTASVGLSTLPVARAFENQVHFVTSNNVGEWWISHTRGKVKFFGGSIIVSATGEVLATADDAECTIEGKLTSADLRKSATFLPIFRDRTPHNYELLTHSSSVV